MALSVQNKKFLSLLHKLDIGLTYVSDKTFDGLFENIPEPTNYFFNWFLENITEDNALSDSEEAMYFEMLKKNEEGISSLLPLPTAYEEMQSLDLKYINSTLPDELQDLDKTLLGLNDVLLNFESNYSEVKKKNVSLSENVNIWRKKLNSVTVDCNNTISLVVSKFDEIKKLLLKEPHINLDLDSYNSLFLNERNIFSNLKSSIVLEDNITSSSNYIVLPELRESLTCVKNFFILSQVSLKEKKCRREVLSEMFQNNGSVSFSHLNLITSKDVSHKISDSICVLEKEIQKKISSLSQFKVLKIQQQNLIMKTESYQRKLNSLKTCREHIKSNAATNLWVMHTLLKYLKSIESIKETRKELQTKLSEQERNTTINIANFKLRKCRFGGISSKANQHPLLLALQNVLQSNTDLLTSDTCLEKLNDILSHANDDANFATHNERTSFKTTVKSILDNKLCGSTCELQFVPTDLFVKYQDCDSRKNELSHEMKRVVSRYVEAKETISKSNRRKLLSWIEFITNPEDLHVKVENLDKSVDRSRFFMSIFKES